MFPAQPARPREVQLRLSAFAGDTGGAGPLRYNQCTPMRGRLVGTADTPGDPGGHGRKWRNW